MNIKVAFEAINSVVRECSYDDAILALTSEYLTILHNGQPIWSHSMKAPLELEVDLDKDISLDLFKRMARIVFQDFENNCYDVHADYTEDDECGEDARLAIEQDISWAREILGELLK